MPECLNAWPCLQAERLLGAPVGEQVDLAPLDLFEEGGALRRQGSVLDLGEPVDEHVRVPLAALLEEGFGFAPPPEAAARALEEAEGRLVDGVERGVAPGLAEPVLRVRQVAGKAIAAVALAAMA